MKKSILFLTSLVWTMALCAKELAPSKKETVDNSAEVAAEKKQPDLRTVSRSFGHMVGKNLADLELNLDTESMILGIQEHFQKVPSPLSESDCIQEITAMQEIAFQQKSTENLQLAEEFLEKNKTNKDVVELENGKLQYIRIKEGTGAIVEEHYAPKIRYEGSLLDGKVFGESKEGEKIVLDEMLEGFQKGIVGMKEGEHRKLFIHPELGAMGFLPPNSLLIFDVEVCEANVITEEDTAALNEDILSEEEIAADPLASPEKVR